MARRQGKEEMGKRAIVPAGGHIGTQHSIEGFGVAVGIDEELLKAGPEVRLRFLNELLSFY